MSHMWLRCGDLSQHSQLISPLFDLLANIESDIGTGSKGSTQMKSFFVSDIHPRAHLSSLDHFFSAHCQLIVTTL